MCRRLGLSIRASLFAVALWLLAAAAAPARSDLPRAEQDPVAARFALTAGSAMAELATIDGEASYRERSALRPGTVLEVELLDISRADAPSQRLASVRIKVQGQVPIPFTLHYDPGMIEQNRSYAVTAKLILQSKVVFRSDTVHPVLTRGAGDTVAIVMVRTAAEDAPPPAETGAAEAGDEPALVGPTWVAEDIQGRGVIDDLQSHITFTAEGQAQGSGGCNNFTGGYTLAGATLALGPLASTKKACPPAIMNQEDRFHQALARTRGYRFENGLLFLLDAEGTPVMRLWRRD